MVEAAHKQGLPYVLHICGDTEAILPQMMESGADGFELDYKTDVNKAFDLMHDKCTFLVMLIHQECWLLVQLIRFVKPLKIYWQYLARQTILS